MKTESLDSRPALVSRDVVKVQHGRVTELDHGDQRRRVVAKARSSG
jgi:hypothetical protein